jgi:hypothetical protein
VEGGDPSQPRCSRNVVKKGDVDVRRYRIVVRGEHRDLIANDFKELILEPGRGVTRLTADVVDSCELYGILDRFRDLSIEVVSLNEI